MNPSYFGESERFNSSGQSSLGAAVVTRATSKRKETVWPLVANSPGDLTNNNDVRLEVESDGSLQGVRKGWLEGKVMHYFQVA